MSVCVAPHTQCLCVWTLLNVYIRYCSKNPFAYFQSNRLYFSFHSFGIFSTVHFIELPSHRFDLLNMSAAIEKIWLKRLNVCTLCSTVCVCDVSHRCLSTYRKYIRIYVSNGWNIDGKEIVEVAQNAWWMITMPNI